MEPSLQDLRRIYYGADSDQTVSDAEYQYLLQAYQAGIDATELLDFVSTYSDTYQQLEAPLAVGEATVPRTMINQFAVGLNTQVMYLSYFKAVRSELITKLLQYNGATAAGATPTLVRWGIYEIAANGNGVLVASIPNDTSIYAAAHTPYERNLSVAFNKVKGQVYALGTLVVTAAAVPTPVMASLPFLSNVGLELVREPKVSGVIINQLDLPANFLNAAVVPNGSQACVRIYTRLNP